MDFKKHIQEIKKQIKEVSTHEVRKKMERPDDFVLIDVRDPEEVEKGYLPQAKNLPKSFIELKINDAVLDPHKEIVLYCGGGTRSAFAAKSLQDMGYKNVFSMAGGFRAWQNEGFPLEQKQGLSAEQKSRYARHISLPEVGEPGQLKLLQAKVLIVGAGGLGSPAALYLAAAGVGTLGIVDHDVVDRSNLQRQILHDESMLGQPKVDSAKIRLGNLNPNIHIHTHSERLTRANTLDVLKNYDIIVNGCDNFPTRYLVNDACVFLKKPLVDGSIFRFEGQVTVFDVAKCGPCYRCLYPKPPEAPMNCEEAGVFGALPGLIGMMQAIEVIKLIINLGQPLTGKLMLYNALEQSFKTLITKRDKNCPVCGDNPKIRELIDYEKFCFSS